LKSGEPSHPLSWARRPEKVEKDYEIPDILQQNSRHLKVIVDFWRIFGKSDISPTFTLVIVFEVRSGSFLKYAKIA
jgi:hypothetical protein